MPVRDTAWPPGTPCWVDYGAADLDAAKTFYSNLLGWTYSGGDSEYGHYLIAEVGDRSAAGIAPQDDPSDPPRWTTYFATDDADATATRITANGGTIVVEPMDVGPMGRMAIARDPEGNPFGLWQAGENTGVGVHNEPGGLAWNDAAVDDTSAAQAFYGAVFDFAFTPMEWADDYATFATTANPLGGIGANAPGTPRGWTTCFSVANTDEAVAKAEKGGGQVAIAASDTPYGRFAIVEDPWGAAFAVMDDQVPEDAQG